MPPMPTNVQVKEKCSCVACVRDRQRVKNRWYLKHGKPEKVVPLAPANAQFRKCDCRLCAHRRANALKYSQRGRKVQDAPEPFVKGRKYEWDRTTPADYGMNSITN